MPPLSLSKRRRNFQFLFNSSQFNLKVSSLFVNGEKKKGEFTAANLSILTGEGSLIVGGPGFAIIIR